MPTNLESLLVIELGGMSRDRFRLERLKSFASRTADLAADDDGVEARSTGDIHRTLGRFDALDSADAQGFDDP